MLQHVLHAAIHALFHSTLIHGTNNFGTGHMQTGIVDYANSFKCAAGLSGEHLLQLRA